MRVGDENLADLAKIVARLNYPRRHAASGVDQVKRAVDDKEIRRRRAAAAAPPSSVMNWRRPMKTLI
jgi:hypothetical protein